MPKYILIFLAVAFIFPMAQAETTDPHLFVTPAPAFGIDVNIPNDVLTRHVFGSLAAYPGNFDHARIDITNCIGGIYARFDVAPLEPELIAPFSLTLPGGHCYEFVNTNDPVGLNQLLPYSYVDVVNETSMTTMSMPMARPMTSSILGIAITSCAIGLLIFLPWGKHDT